MARPRLCPNCHTTIPFGQGYRFDEKYNMICLSCDKVAFPADPAEEPPKSPQRQQYGMKNYADPEIYHHQ